MSSPPPPSSESTLNVEVVRKLTEISTVPLVFRGYVEEWPLCDWSVEKWCNIFGDREIPFRCMKKSVVSDDPCWERKCHEKKMTFQTFVDNLSSENWMYFDYKHIQQWFRGETELSKEVSWKKFGYSSKGAADSTLWVGNSGAHTPAHQDTYGINIVAQLHGKKRWILFPPEAGGLRPTRVPYEESSIYSELNFFCPKNLEPFNALTGCRIVELNAGDALLVPRGWWHYVQNMEPINIALNIWLRHERDSSALVSEALVKLLVAQICKDLPEETAKLLVNPNEEDISETPMTVLFLQLEAAANTHLDIRRKARRIKRQKTCEDDRPISPTEDFNMKNTLDNKANNLEEAPIVSSEDLINVLKENVRVFGDTESAEDEDDVDNGSHNVCLTKAVIDAFSQSNVIDLVKQNLFARLD